MPRRTRTHQIVYWHTTYRALLPDEREEYARRRAFDARVGKTAATRMRDLQGVHERLPEFEKAEADAAVRRDAK